MIVDHRFQLQKKIGSGASGKVYLAKDLSSNSPCALKIFKDESEYHREKNIYGKLIIQNVESYSQMYIHSATANTFPYYIALKMMGQSLNQEIKSLKQCLQLEQIILLGISLV
ncbi:protein kinase [Stylonychia lemnae]|uniref:Protein kinase n=1 Tax=Stylonychia lemnae TaxID=5949 RepID=A0A078A816_STYLE|nr:protein kinase [Stylonychia lemnae]|eukprot:CDW77727.1 protein kinase [Stylonychia lemnae]